MRRRRGSMRLSACALLAALDALLRSSVRAAVDVVAQLHNLQSAYESNGSVANDVAPPIILSNAPEVLLQRLTQRSLRWDALSGFLQRALLWDSGLVLTHDGRLVQVYVPCGDTMSAVFVDKEAFNTANCPVEACNDGSLHFASSFCSFAAVHHVAQCAIDSSEEDAGDITDAKAGSTVWAEDGELTNVPDIRLFRHAVEEEQPEDDDEAGGSATNGTISAASEDDSGNSDSEGLGVVFSINQVEADQVSTKHCPSQALFIAPCTQRHTDNAQKWCVPARGGFADLWLDAETGEDSIATGSSDLVSSEAMSHSSSAGLSTGTIALVALLILLAGTIGGLLAVYANRSRHREKHDSPSSPTMFTNATTTRSKQRGPATGVLDSNQDSTLTADTAMNSLGETRRRRSLELASFCADAHIASKRIDYESLVLEKLVARGASGEVWYGTYGQQVVAIKQLVPEKRHDQDTVALFAHEVRLAATLVHPNIVRFVGLSWNRVCDLCIVSEFMTRGDLSTLLKSKRSSQLSWAKEKLALATDIAEALAYLHSRRPLIIHRDLKSLNVLLDARLRAKLSDFGLSREKSLAETMTSGVGTLLWTAPEILRGETYTEKADVYSYAIVLSELDTCLPPFTLNEEVSERNLTTMQLMHLATSGEVSPKLRVDCPASVQQLTASCAAFDPAQRPTALQIVFTLRTIARGMRYQ